MRLLNLRWIRFLCLAVLIMLPTSVSADLPQSAGWVNDFANVISPEYREKITQVITELEIKTTAEIAVVTQTSINGESEFTYAQRLFDDWKIGKAGKDNGVLILVAVEERAWRIHTGYGVEGILPDAICDAIGRNQMVPFLKNNDYSQGIYYGVVEIAKTIAQDAGVSLSSLDGVAVPQQQEAQSSEVPLLVCLFMFGFFLVWNIPWPIFIGLPFTLIFAGAFGSASPMAFIAIMAGYIGSMMIRIGIWKKMPAKDRPALWKVIVFGLMSMGGKGKGGGRSGGFGGGGFGGGGFSGGGGGFGGGRSGGGGGGGRF